MSGSGLNCSTFKCRGRRRMMKRMENEKKETGKRGEEKV
jgi:hypothetical protein